MRKQFLSLLAATTVLFSCVQQSWSQNSSPYWSLAGNSNASASSKLGTTTNINLRLFTNNQERVRILSSNGYVGIGTTNPQQRLHVEGTSNQAIFVNTSAVGTTSGSGMIGYVKGLPTASGHRLGYFLLGSRGGAESNYNAAGMVGYAGGAWTAGASHPAYLAFETTPSGSTTRAERLRIAANGFVGIGTTAPNDKLHVIGRGRFSNGLSVEEAGIYTYHSAGNGVEGYGESASYGSGVYGSGYRGVYGSGVAYGVQGYSYNGLGGSFESFNSWGLEARTTNGYYAGVFYGNVYHSGALISSDKNLKQNAQELTDAMSLIGKLKPQHYEYKHEGKYAFLNLPKGTHYGLMAQDVEEVLPNLVHTADHVVRQTGKESVAAKPYTNSSAQPTAQAGAQKTETISVKAVNYTELIPIMIKGMQEQQQENDELKARVAKLEGLVSKLTGDRGPNTVTGAGSLNQATPNPATSTTRISYRLPQNTGRARLLLTDNGGKTVKVLALNNSGIVDINTASLSSGIYNYPLLIAGKIIETKKLTIIR